LVGDAQALPHLHDFHHRRLLIAGILPPQAHALGLSTQQAPTQDLSKTISYCDHLLRIGPVFSVDG